MISTLPKVRSFIVMIAISAVVLFVYCLSETTQLARERVISGYLKKEFSKNDSITRAIRDKSRTFYQVHVENAEDKKRVTLLGVELEYRLPDVALCGILNLLVTANIQCAVHPLALGGMVVIVACLPQPEMRQSPRFTAGRIDGIPVVCPHLRLTKTV